MIDCITGWATKWTVNDFMMDKFHSLSHYEMTRRKKVLRNSKNKFLLNTSLMRLWSPFQTNVCSKDIGNIVQKSSQYAQYHRTYSRTIIAGNHHVHGGSEAKVYHDFRGSQNIEAHHIVVTKQHQLEVPVSGQQCAQVYTNEVAVKRTEMAEKIALRRRI